MWPRLVKVDVERFNGHWFWTIGLAWPCGCVCAGAGRTPWKALRWAVREHGGRVRADAGLGPRQRVGV